MKVTTECRSSRVTSPALDHADALDHHVGGCRGPPPARHHQPLLPTHTHRQLRERDFSYRRP